jgi:hypothetical protein
MNIRQTRDLPAPLEEVRRRFERSRRTRKPRSHIPDSLWASAVKMARIYGINRTARALRFDYYALKKRVEQEAAAVPGVPEQGAVATFLELAPPVQIGSGECLWELEDAGGAKMRVHQKGFQTPDLASLSRSFWNPGP